MSDCLLTGLQDAAGQPVSVHNIIYSVADNNDSNKNCVPLIYHKPLPQQMNKEYPIGVSVIELGE